VFRQNSTPRPPTNNRTTPKKLQAMSEVKTKPNPNLVSAPLSVSGYTIKKGFEAQKASFKKHHGDFKCEWKACSDGMYLFVMTQITPQSPGRAD
jgi:hypothetical protein